LITGQGSCVLLYNDVESGLNLELVGWIGSISTRAYVSQSDSVHYLRILGGDVSMFGKHFLFTGHNGCSLPDRHHVHGLNPMIKNSDWVSVFLVESTRSYRNIDRTDPTKNWAILSELSIYRIKFIIKTEIK